MLCEQTYVVLMLWVKSCGMQTYLLLFLLFTFEGGKKLNSNCDEALFLKKRYESKRNSCQCSSSPSYSTIVIWTNVLKFDWESLQDDSHSGQPRCTTIPEMIAKV